MSEPHFALPENSDDFDAGGILCESIYEYLEVTNTSKGLLFHCLSCSVCNEGEGVQTECAATKDTVCRKCTTKEYSNSFAGEDEKLCYPCTDCEKMDRNAITACTRSKDAKCGSCLKGRS